MAYGRFRNSTDARHQRAPVVRGTKRTCDVCGKSLDAYHDERRCTAEWLKKIDAEGNPSNTRGAKP